MAHNDNTSTPDTPVSISTPDRDTRLPVSGGIPVVVMLGLFTACQTTVSAVTLEGSDTVWLDLITTHGHATPLGVVTAVSSADPRLTVTHAHRHWAGRIEVRWKLTREAKLLHHDHYRHRPVPYTPQRNDDSGSSRTPLSSREGWS
jgi:hypothetical protein